MRILEWLGIAAADDVHSVLSDAFSLAALRQRRLAVLRAWHADLRSDRYLVRGALVLCSHVVMLVRSVVLCLAGKTVVWREFWNLPLLATFFILYPLRKRIYFNINHNMGARSGRVPAALRFLSRTGFRFLLFDGGLLEQRFAACRNLALRCPPFPVAGARRDPDRRKAVDAARLAIGIAGDFRAEKGGISELRSVIAQLTSIEAVDVLIGARNEAAVAERLRDLVQSGRCRTFGTATRESYFAFLGQIDMIVILADPDAYWARHSGTIVDAASFGVVVIAPALAVFESQVNHPVPIGATYRSSEELAQAVAQARLRLGEFQRNVARYVRARSELSIDGAMSGRE